MEGSGVGGGEKRICDILLVEIICPTSSIRWSIDVTQVPKIGCLPLLRSQKVRLVDEKEVTPEATPSSLFAFGALDIQDIGFQVLTSEVERISRINDLYDEVRTLQDSPKLAPHLYVPFERCEEKFVSILESGQVKTRKVFQRSVARTRPIPFSNQGRHLSLVDPIARWSRLVSKPAAAELGGVVGFQPVSSARSARLPRLASGGYGLRWRAC